ncbi:hypothetical protein KAS08_03720 [Candidatus Pacearchaeota archaeon]|nr:hypothetical protein [Candidatus Pacearchaeota archaeon]
MIVKLQFESEDGSSVYDGQARESILRGKLGDSVIRAIDRAMNGASWEATGNGWIARQ